MLENKLERAEMLFLRTVSRSTAGLVKLKLILWKQNLKALFFCEHGDETSVSIGAGNIMTF
jgi:hypothetical protein